MADDAAGVVQLIRMVLAEQDAAKLEKDMQEALKKGSDPAKANQNIDKVDGAFERLGKTIRRVAEFMIARALIRGIINFGKEAVAAALESRKEWGLLDNAVKNTGASVSKIRAEAEQTAAAFKRAGVAGDEEFARALRSLVQISGDAEKSLANMGVVADLAAARNISLEESANLVAKAMNGQVTMLQRLGIVIPEGADAVKFLAEQFKGAAEAVDPAVREQKLLAETWDDLKEAVGEAILAVKEGESFTTILTNTIQTMTRVINDNRGAIQSLGSNLFWLGKQVIANVVLLAYQGWATAISVVADGLAVLDKATIAFGKSVGREASPEILAEVAALEAFSAKAAKAAVDVEALRKAILAPMPKSSPLGALPGGPVGGAIKGAKGGDKEKTPEQLEDERRKKMRDRIEAAREGLEFDDLRAESIIKLLELEQELSAEMEKGNLTFEERVQVSKNLKDVQDAMIEGLKGMAAQAGVSEDALQSLWEGNWRAALKSIAKDALWSAGWNIAKAIEMAARSAGAASSGNLVGAAIAAKAAKGHLAAAAKFGALAGGAAAASASGDNAGGAASNGPTAVGADAANKVQPPGVQVTVYVDGVDPYSPKHQALNQQLTQQMKERYGESSTITVIPRTGR